MATKQAKTDAQNLKEYLEAMQHLRPLDPSEEAVCLSLARQQDARALRRLSESYLPRVVAWVAPQRGRGMTFAQLIETGNRAVLRRLQSGATVPLLETLRQAVTQAVDAALQTSRR